jgi:glyoxylase-like metal-dependent hydrolase (beta-lactamase superfamily II)
VAVVTLALAAGCQGRPRRVPYIPPDLADWPGGRRALQGLRLHVFATTGSIEPPAALVGRRSLERVVIQVPAFLIEHPRAGLVLVGTGLSPALVEDPAEHLGWLLAAVARPVADEARDLVAQLKAAGFEAGAVRHVVLADCRFPQTGQIDRFAGAEVAVGVAERRWAVETSGAPGVRLRDLLAVHRWAPVDFAHAPPLGTLEHAHDLLGDGSIVLLDTPGYTPGTMAVLVRLPGGPVVLGGGAVPFGETLRMPAVPLVATNRDDWWLSAWRLKRFRELAEGLTVVPGFDVANVVEDGARPDIRVHRSTDGETPESRRDTRPAFPIPDPPTSPPPPRPLR